MKYMLHMHNRNTKHTHIERAREMNFKQWSNWASCSQKYAWVYIFICSWQCLIYCIITTKPRHVIFRKVDVLCAWLQHSKIFMRQYNIQKMDCGKLIQILLSEMYNTMRIWCEWTARICDVKRTNEHDSYKIQRLPKYSVTFGDTSATAYRLCAVQIFRSIFEMFYTVTIL